MTGDCHSYDRRPPARVHNLISSVLSHLEQHQIEHTKFVLEKVEYSWKRLPHTQDIVFLLHEL